MARVRKLQQIEFVVGLIAGMMLIVYWLIVATVPTFFFVSITGENSQLRRAELLLSTFGWILSSTVAPVALMLYASGFHRARHLLPYTALVWPISLIISQFTVYILNGSFYLSYLIKYPIFFYTDILLPIFIMILWHDLREEDKPVQIAQK